MGMIYNIDCSSRDARMAAEVGTNEIAIPGPLVACIAGRVNSSIATASSNIALECGLLIGIKHLPARHEEDNRVVMSQIRIGKHCPISGKIHHYVVLARKFLEGCDSIFDRGMMKGGGFYEDKY